MAIAPPEPRPAPSLPRPIRRGLGRVDRKLRLLGALRGLGTAALVLALGAALGMAADFFWELSRGARWAIWGAWVAAGGLALLLGVVRPLVRRLGWTDLAAVAERGFPGLGERLTGAVGLLAGRPHGSPALIAALADEAAAQTRTLNLARAVPAWKARLRFALGAGALGLVLAPAVVRPDPFAALWHRFLAPWAGLDRVGRFVITVEPGNRVVPLGSDLTISATVRPRFLGTPVPDDAW
ncbi:MAG TPA: hypothetical protein VF590_23235, partial [Isosphaeraceae bacterium]